MAVSQASAPKPEPAKKPTRATFTKYLEVREARLAKDRESSALKKEEDALADVIATYVREAGGKTRSVECCGHRAAITSKPGSPSWLAEFTKVQGLEEVERLKAAAPMRDSLTVTKL